MLFVVLSIVLLVVMFFLLNEYVKKITGLKDAVFYCKTNETSWIVETAWLDNITGQVCKITTTSNWQDGVVSVLNNDEIIYHTKQPFDDRQDLQRFHQRARTRFFLHIKWRSIIESKTVQVLTGRA